MSKYTEYVLRMQEGLLPSYYTVDRLPSGMSMEFGFYFEIRDLPKEGQEMVIYPYMTVYSKRKKSWPDDPAQTTGKDGLRPAVVALQHLEELESTYRDDSFTQLRVCVEWADNRRRDVYHKVLSRRGYYFDRWDGKKVLTKVIRSR